MSDFPLVSIITPSFNCAKYIEKTILSVLSQDYPRIEHWVIDGGSTDGTVELLRSYAHLHWISEPDKGQSDALNKGFRKATGEIIGWLNADDVYEPGAILRAVDFLQTHPDCDLVYGDCYVIDEDGKRIGVQPSTDYSWETLLEHYVFLQPSSFMRRRVIEATGGVNTSLHYVMDHEWWLRIAQQGFHFQRLPGALAAFRLRPGSKTTTQPVGFWQERLLITERTLAQDSTLSEAAKSSIRRRLYYKAGITFLSAGEETMARAYLRPAFADDAPPYPLSFLAEDLVGHAERCADTAESGAQEEQFLERFFGIISASPHQSALKAQTAMVLTFAAAKRDRSAQIRRFGRYALLHSAGARRNLGLWKLVARAYFGPSVVHAIQKIGVTVR